METVGFGRVDLTYLLTLHYKLAFFMTDAVVLLELDFLYTLRATAPSSDTSGGITGRHHRGCLRLGSVAPFCPLRPIQTARAR